MLFKKIEPTAAGEKERKKDDLKVLALSNWGKAGQKTGVVGAVGIWNLVLDFLKF